MPGLTDVLLGDAELDDVLLEHADMPGLMALTCGSTPPNPSELLGSRTFRTLVERLTGLADLVIFDSPPVLAAADAQILASQMDGTVLVVEAGATKKGAARRTLALLRHARANVLGVAYNKMRNLEGSAYYYYYHYQYTHPALPTEKDKRRTSKFLELTGSKAIPVAEAIPVTSARGHRRRDRHRRERMRTNRCRCLVGGRRPADGPAARPRAPAVRADEAPLPRAAPGVHPVARRPVGDLRAGARGPERLPDHPAGRHVPLPHRRHRPGGGDDGGAVGARI